MENLVIKKAAPDDAYDLSLIETQCFSTPWSEKSLKEFINCDSSHVLTASVDDKTVGYIGMYYSFGEGDITNVAVMNNYRNMGIAKKLISELIELSKKTGISILRLEVRQSNIVAISLYKKFGFYEVGIRKNYYSHPKENAVLMDLNIDTATDL
ncbi:MAG: ribosomal-protein-alanine N-acetyltransferase [Ruminococcaceae bacterium]|nr:ribosomal-protein-alanine N-acetyltransferase [Oscillospiraceae bacterium]